jgi:GNAT superfamily N-acetyltransferase
MATMTPASTVAVRQLGVANWEQLRDVRLRALRDTPSAYFGKLADEEGFDESRWRTWLGPANAIFVAESNDAEVGLIGGVPADQDEGGPDAVMMFAMWVSPDARGTGVAERLTDALISWARGRGYPRMVLWVYDVNPRAAAFYRRYGFLPTGRTETFGDDPRLLHMMTLDL